MTGQHAMASAASRRGRQPTPPRSGLGVRLLVLAAVVALALGPAPRAARPGMTSLLKRIRAVTRNYCAAYQPEAKRGIPRLSSGWYAEFRTVV